MSKYIENSFSQADKILKKEKVSIAQKFSRRWWKDF